MPLMDVEMHVVGRLVAAAALGAAIGIERETADQPAGLRTHLTVALGAALFGVVSTVGFEEFRTTQRAVNIQFDVTRVASTVVTGIGFLGAGMIFRRGSTVHNLTTAASLWVVAAIGLSCGVGDIGPATVGAAILVVALLLLRYPKEWLRRNLGRDHDAIRILLVDGVDSAEVEQQLRSLPGIDVKALNVEKEDGAYVVATELVAKPQARLREQLSVVAHRPDVRSLTIGAAATLD